MIGKPSPTMPLRQSNSVLYGLMVKDPIKKERIITHIMDRANKMYLLTVVGTLPIAIAKIKKTSNAKRKVILQNKSIVCISKRHRVTHSPMT